MKDDGGPAYPVETSRKSVANGVEYGHQTGNTTWQFPGMTLRDYFAAKAMLMERHPYDQSNGAYADFAGKCYDLADAMLAERERAK